MNIQFWPIAKLVPYKRALRKNNHAVAQMVAAIEEFGFRIPILATSSGEVIDGHLRLKAAQKLGMNEVPVIVCDGWSEQKVSAFRLLVNRSATWADWDLDLVALEIGELRAMNFDLSLTGFDSLEIDTFLFGKKKQPGPGPDSAPKVTKTGDLWLCGDHRVLCADCTGLENVTRLFGASKPVLMVTDPPYGVEYDPGWRERADLGKARQTGKVANDDRVDWTAAYGLFPGDVAYVWHAGVHAAEVARGLESVGFVIRSQIIWVKQQFALSRGDYHYKHEPCLYAVRDGKTSHWSGDRTQHTVWEVANLNPFGNNTEDRPTGHGTQKPLELMRRPILNNTERGEVVYDPFLGSGTTLIAAEHTERICHGLEIEPNYVDMIVIRWQDLTGKMATLEGDGRTFHEIARERLGGVDVMVEPEEEHAAA